VRQASTAPATRRHRERGWRAKLFRDARRRDDGDRWAIQPRRDTGTSAFFRGQNVNWGQRSPIMRIFLFVLFFCVYFSVHGKVLINSYLQVTLPRLFSRIRWSFHTSYRVSLVPAESDRYGAYSAGAVAARRQNGVAVAHTEGVGSRSSAWTPRTKVRGSPPNERSACNMTQLP